MAVLFSGHFLDYGVANPGSVCYSYAYALIGRMSAYFVNQQGLIAAHEIAHVMAATHKDDPPCTNTIMNEQYTTSTAMTFCQPSRDQIIGHISTYGLCVTPKSRDRVF